MKNFTRLLFLVVLLIVFQTAGAKPPLDTQTDSPMTPAKVLKAMQGKWKVSGVFMPSAGDKGQFPKEISFTKEGTEIVIKGNLILSKGKLLATIANDIDLPDQQKEVGFKESKLLLLTLPTGKGILCSYDLLNDNLLQFAYTHKCFCYRGSGHVLQLDRTEK